MYLDERKIYRSELLDKLEWLEHGFGTRQSILWPPPYTSLKQTHSDTVVEAAESRGCLGQGDALITRAAGNLIGIRTADCVPILLADPEHRAVGVIHAGWRGSAAGIVAKTAHRMASAFGTDPATLRAVVGPCIRNCCFEVGPEVSAHFPHAARGRYVDLEKASMRQMIDAGILERNIDVAGLCTRCGGDLFHSFRRDRELSGRMVSAIGIRKPV